MGLLCEAWWDPRGPHRNVADCMARQPARQSLQFRSCRAKRLDLLLNLTAAGQTDAGETDAGHDTVTVDIETGTTRMKYLHDPLPGSGAGEEPTKSNSRVGAPALAGVATVRDARGAPGPTSALSPTDVTGSRLSLRRMASADRVRTKGFGLALCSAR
jgi:hypothetical protein